MNTDVSSVGTIICYLDQRILHIDDHYGDIVQRDRRSLIGQQALSFTHADDLSANQPALDRLVVDGPGFTIVKRYVRGDGSLVWVKNHVTKIKDGIGSPLICATTQPIERPFGSERLARNHEAARRLCSALVAGRRHLTSDIVWAPGIEALLWLYRVELEGRTLSVEELAVLTASAPKVMVRWARLLQERRLAVGEEPGPLSEQTCIRISREGERKLDGLLAGLTN